MDTLLNLHGKFCGTFWVCETCDEIGWSPKFNSKNEMEMHINKIHSKAKTNKNHIDNKISMIIKTIKEHDEQFVSLIDSEFGDCFEKIQFLIGYEENLNDLDESAFEYLINQIETFYSEKDNDGSLVNYNYLIDYNADVITGNKVAFITEAQTVNENMFITCDIEKVDPHILVKDEVKDIVNNSSYDFTETITKSNDDGINGHSKENVKTEELSSNFLNKLEKNNIGDHDSTTEEIIACDYCLYKTKEIKYLEWHMETFHEEEIFICEKCNFSSQLKRGIIIHMETEHHEQGKIVKSDDQISLNTNEDVRDKCIINKTQFYPNDCKNGNDLIKKDSIFVANVEYDDVLIDSVIDDFPRIEDLTITNYDWYTTETESSCVSIKDELLNYDKNNKKLPKRQCGRNIEKGIKSDLNGKYWTDFPSQQCNQEGGQLRRSSRRENKQIHVKMEHNFIKK